MAATHSSVFSADIGRFLQTVQGSLQTACLLFVVVLVNVPSIYINLKAFVHMDERSVGHKVCAKLTESFWVRVTIDDLTDKQGCLSERVDKHVFCHLLHVFCILQ